MQRFNKAVAALRDGAEAEEFERFDVIQFTAVGGVDGNMDGRQIAGLLGAQGRDGQQSHKGRRPQANGLEHHAYPLLSGRLGIIRRTAGFS